MFSLIYAWINGWVNNPEAGDLRRYRDHYDVTVMNDSVALSENPIDLTIIYSDLIIKKINLVTIIDSLRPSNA